MPRLVRDGEPEMRQAYLRLRRVRQPLVLDHRAQIDLRQLVIAAEVQRLAIGPDLDGSVRALPHVDVTTD
jgi:hypothetical protein